MTPDFKRQLSAHCENHCMWLSDFLAVGKDDPTPFDKFPYRPKEKGKAVISPSHQFSHNNEFLPKIKDVKIFYLITMPMLARNLHDNHAKLKSNISIIQKESFGTTDEESTEEVARRIGLVVGYNRPVSLDARVNEKFASYMENVPDVDGMALRVLGFMWEAEWEPTVSNKYLYSKEKAYLILRVLRPLLAAKLLYEIDKCRSVFGTMKSQIPYQSIREHIKNHPLSAAIVTHVRLPKQSPHIYVASLDDDLHGLRSGYGLYSRYEMYINAQKELPHVLSTGYSAPTDQGYGMELAVLLDMLVRQATAIAVPQGPYIPEPNFIFILAKTALLSNYSYRGGSSQRLESRRLIQNGEKSGLIDPKKIRFFADGIPTDVNRLETKNIAKYEDTPSKKTFATKGFLTALHGISQTHTFAHVWADNLYVALSGLTGPVTDSTTHLMKIYGVFDPIGLITNWHASIHEGYSSTHFVMWKENYKGYTDRLTRATDDSIDTHAQAFAALFFDKGKNATSYNNAVTFFEEKWRSLHEAKQGLINKGLSEPDSEKVQSAAKYSGAAVHQGLSLRYNAL